METEYFIKFNFKKKVYNLSNVITNQSIHNVLYKKREKNNMKNFIKIKIRSIRKQKIG